MDSIQRSKTTKTRTNYYLTQDKNHQKTMENSEMNADVNNRFKSKCINQSNQMSV